MIDWDDGIQGIHRNIAADNSPALHVLAGPGTGKTFAMMRRIARLLQTGVAPDEILAVTFTRTAARDLREQLATLGVPGAEDVLASTLHSLCFKILGSQQAFSFTARAPRPLMSFELDALEQDLAGRFGGKRSVRKLLAAYEAGWARLQRDAAGFAPSAEDQEFETTLLSWLRFHQAMLIGELVPLALMYARSNPSLPVFPVFSHVLVDEFQDLNKADQTLVRSLTAFASVFVIGDDNQSIYSFRHANPEGIRSFPVDVAGTVEYSIKECRRCPPNIVRISNALISHDPHTSRPAPLLPDESKADAAVHIVQHNTLGDEITTTADFVDHYLKRNPGTAPGRALVLTPRRFIGNAIRDALIARGRNALSYFQEDALEVEAAAEGFCLLTLLAQPHDRVALRTWLGFGNSNHRVRPYSRLREFCEANGKAIQETLEDLSSGKIRIPHTNPLIVRWRDLQARLAQLASLDGAALVDALWSAENADLVDIRTVAGAVAKATPEPSKLLANLRGAITQPELPGSDGDIIQVMSLHKSKGLTRDLVVIAGCMAGALPNIDPDETQEVQNHQLEEQRRLFYVGITRATQVLAISAAVALPLRDALRGGARVSRKTYVGGQAVAITALTPFVGELGQAAPAPTNTAGFRAAVGL